MRWQDREGSSNVEDRRGSGGGGAFGRGGGYGVRGGIFREAGKQYSPARLVLYTGQTSTACGYGQSAMGPFYCPADEKVYLDLSFYRDMQNHLGGGGDFALGYVLAHEVGHHVQNQLGITDRVSGLERGAPKKEANRLSVMLELQADCFAGV